MLGKMLIINMNFLPLGITNERPVKEMWITLKYRKKHV